MNIRNPKNTLGKKPIYSPAKQNIIGGDPPKSNFDDTVDDIKKYKPELTNDFLDEIVKVFIETEKIIIVICNVIYNKFDNKLLAETVHIQILNLIVLDDTFIKFIKTVNSNKPICKKNPKENIPIQQIKKENIHMNNYLMNM